MDIANKPVRIQLSREKGWKMPPNTAKVDRTTHWGNPFRIGERPDRKLLARWMWKLSPRGMSHITQSDSEAVKLFSNCIAFDDASFHLARKELRGKNLACWCALDRPCHADVLLDLANSH